MVGLLLYLLCLSVCLSVCLSLPLSVGVVGVGCVGRG